MSQSQSPPEKLRTDRLSGPDRPDAKDSRDPYQRDRDRILYSEYFRRLAGVTQVVSATEGEIFHNRLTHSLKVAQVARRIAERLLRDNPSLAAHLDPEVVEAAALAHDLGHPPFGHVAEKQLCKDAESFELEDGFEGNAQTFRILTRLSVHRGKESGLELTRATLNAVLKYPWKRSDDKTSKHHSKYSCYSDDSDAFTFARGLHDSGSEALSIEAHVMDVADSITYSVHDLEDFYRAGLIPLEKLARNENYRSEFLNRWKESGRDPKAHAYAEVQSNFRKIKNLLEYCLSDTDEGGSRRELQLLEEFRSAAITEFLSGITISTTGGLQDIQMDPELRYQCKFLQRLVWDYVILNPRLATQQAGQEKIVSTLAHFFKDNLTHKRPDRIPSRFRKTAEELINEKADRKLARLAIDIVASLTESEAISLFKRVTGQHQGSILDRMP